MEVRRIGTRVRRWLLYGVGVPILNACDAVIGWGSAVTDSAVCDPDEFPWSQEVTDNWEAIRDEIVAVMQTGTPIPDIQAISTDLDHLTRDHGWRSYFLFAYGNESHLNCARCPETARLLKRLPGITNAMFSFLAPGKHIPRHRGEYKGLIRCHLGLIIPQDRERCRMRVGHQWVTWHSGELMIFDNSREHEVLNDTEELRVILLFDVVRPMRFPLSILNRLIIFMISHSPYVRAAARNHEAWERSATELPASRM